MASSGEISLEEQLNNSVDNIVSEVNKIAEKQLNEQKINYQLNNQTNFNSNNHINLINNNHNSVAISSEQVTSSRQQQQQGIVENQIFQKNHNNNNNLDITNNNTINFSKEDIIYLHNNNQGNIEQNYSKFPQQQQQQQQQQQIGEFKTKIQEVNTSLIGEGQNYQNYQQQGINSNYQIFQNMPKSNEPIKLVYPIPSNSSQHHHHQQQQHQQQQQHHQQHHLLQQHTAQQNQVSIVTMNNNGSNDAGNRVTFTNQTLPNGAINLASQTQQQIMHAVSASGGIQNTGTTIKTISAGSGGIGQQQQQNQIVNSTSAGTTIQTLVIKNQPVSLSAGLVSSAPGMVTMTKTINQGNQQNIVAAPTMIPASVQIVGMRPGTPTQNQQKTVAALSPRVVIGGPHMVGTRPASPAITLSALQNLHSGQSGPALILKTENGQYQLVRVTPPTAPPVATAATQNITNAGNQTIRLQTVPAQQTIATSSANLVVNSVSSANSTQPSLVAQQNSNVQHNTVATVAQVPALAQASHHPQTQHHQQQQHQQIQIQQQNATTISGTTQTTPNSVTQGNTKEKCRKFLANLIELSSREPKPVERNVRTLIQELIDANVEPEEFCDRLERLLNASPQPCLIGFLKKSLPLLRQSLFTKELVIEGIKPPPQNVVGMIGSTTLSTQLPKIQAQIRPISQQTTTIGQTQVRMVTPVPRPMGHTTITKQIGSGVRIQGPIQTSTASTTGQRLMNAQIRPVNVSSGSTGLVQGGSIQSTPGLQPVSGNQSLYSPSQNVVQIRASNAINRSPATLHIRATTPSAPRAPAPTIKNVGSTAITHVKVGQTQIKQIPAQQQNATLHPPPISSNLSSVSSSNNLQINSNANANLNSSNSNNKLVTIKAQIVSKPPSKDKEKKQSAASSASLFQQSAISMSSASMEMDDINDVAAMGGVNLLEESQRILGSTEMIGTQIRSCKDEVFLNLPALQSRIRTIVAEKGLEEPSQEVAVLISHACQERLKNIVEKLAVIAEHRIDIIKMDPRYEITKDVRGQIKFLEELDKAEAKRHEEQEREMLLRAAKSRVKTEDPEQAKLKAKAKEMQRAEMEELRQRDANMTALQAIGPRKKPKLDGDTTVVSQTGVTGVGNSNISTTPLRPRIKRVNLRDMIFFMEQERDLCRSTMLYKTYLK